MLIFGVFLPNIDFLIFLHEAPFLDKGGPEKQPIYLPIYLYWPKIIFLYSRMHEIIDVLARL